MSILINLCLGLFVLVALLMVLVILMQRPKSEGLGAAFGASVTENIFGAQTTNVLVKVTGWLAGFFFALTFALSVLYAHRSTGQSALRRELAKTQPAAQTSPSPAAVTSPSPTATPTSPMPSAAQTSPIASAPPDSAAGVLPAGSASPASSLSPSAQPTVSPTAAAVAPEASPSATAKQRRRKR